MPFLQRIRNRQVIGSGPDLIGWEKVKIKGNFNGSGQECPLYMHNDC